MDATETMMSERTDCLAMARLLACIAPFFARLTEEQYVDAVTGAHWNAVRETVAAEAATDEERARWLAALAPLGASEREALRDELLLPGVPYAVIPVESLYKPWSAQEGNAFGATRGLYMGDAARHMADVYRQLSLDVPEAFASMPDHLALELELLSLMLEAGNEAAARQFARDHFDWLDAYDDALARQRDAIVENEDLRSQRRANLARAIEFLRALVALADRTVRRIA